MIFSAAGDATAGIITGGPAIVGGHLVAGGAQIGGGAAMIGTAITWIGAAYAIYSITTTLIRIIYACESSEYTLDTDRQLKECHGLGSYCASNILGLCIERKEGYCCFNSPLARIMNEQIRPQLGISWGTAKAPQCQGLTIAQLGSVDWSRVDLSEWVALLTQSGLQATPSSVTVDSLTGSGNALATGGSRINAIDRATGQLSGLNLPGVMDKATTQLQSTVGPLP
jgi:conjugal transfer mating pair stabilization protein TraN